MRQLLDERTRERLASGAGVAVFHALLGYALIVGLGIQIPRALDDRLNIFDVPVEVPPPPVEKVIPAEKRNPDPEGAAAPPNLKSKATPVVAPKPKIELKVPPPIVAAPKPAEGAEASSGAAPVPGPGTGAGGIGNGLGSGGSGNGTGGGGGAAIRARLLEGNLSRRDYPRELKRAGIGGEVQVRITVGTNGRVSKCSIVKSSGNFELDDTSCRLIEMRYRFEPARDAQGRPVPDVVRESHVWWTRRQGPMPPPTEAGWDEQQPR
jgi:protein TonB